MIKIKCEVVRTLLFVGIFILGSFRLWANDARSVESSETSAEGIIKKEQDETFNPVPMIFDHISDSHEWHIFSIGETHVTLPLPIILYSKVRKEFFCFSSSRFHHGHETYNNFRIVIPEKGGNGIIEEINQAGEVVDAPLDLSITKNVIGALFVMLLMIWVFVSVANRYKKAPISSPKGLQNLLEIVILFVRDDIAKPSIRASQLPRFMPILLTIFFFILFSNILGLVPIFPAGANLTGNITITMVLALFTFLITTFTGNRHYWADIFNTPGVPIFMKLPIPIMPIVELAGIFMKPIVLMIRLFANMLSGHMIVLVFFSMIFLFGSMSAVAAYGFSVLSLVFAIFMTLLDMLVSFIQAFVFTTLSAMYFGMATSGHEH